MSLMWSGALAGFEVLLGVRPLTECERRDGGAEAGDGRLRRSRGLDGACGRRGSRAHANDARPLLRGDGNRDRERWRHGREVRRRRGHGRLRRPGRARRSCRAGAACRALDAQSAEGGLRRSSCPASRCGHGRCRRRARPRRQLVRIGRSSQCRGAARTGGQCRRDPRRRAHGRRRSRRLRVRRRRYVRSEGQAGRNSGSSTGPGAFPDAAAWVTGLSTAFVGRDDDLERLRRAYRATVESGAPRLVTVLGDAGVGKSRLARELWRGLATDAPEPLRRTGRCLSYGDATTYWPLGEVLREHFRILENDEPEAILARLEGRELLALTLGLDEPFALRALALVDEDEALLEREIARFHELALDWHANETRRLKLQA